VAIVAKVAGAIWYPEAVRASAVGVRRIRVSGLAGIWGVMYSPRLPGQTSRFDYDDPQLPTFATVGYPLT
jgi:hypothetical protein